MPPLTEDQEESQESQLYPSFMFLWVQVCSFSVSLVLPVVTDCPQRCHTQLKAVTPPLVPQPLLRFINMGTNKASN